MRLRLSFVVWLLAGSAVSAQQRQDDKPLGLVQRAADRLAGGEMAEAEGLIDQAWRETLSGAAEDDFPTRVQEIAFFDLQRGHELLAGRRFGDALTSAPAAHQLPLGIMAGGLYLAQSRPLEARKVLERADALPDPRFRRQLIELLIQAQDRMGDLDDAEASLRRKLAWSAPGEKDEVLELKSGSLSCGTVQDGLPAAVNELADFFTRNGRLAKAKAELETAARLDPSRSFKSRAGAGLGLLHWLTNQKRQAEAGELENRLLTMARSASDADLRSAFMLKIAIAENARISRDLPRAEAIYREALSAERLQSTGEKPLTVAITFAGLLFQLGRSPDEGKDWIAWAIPAPTPARVSVTQALQKPPTIKFVEPEAIQSQLDTKSGHLTRADLERAGGALTAVEASRFPTKHAAELARWEQHSPRTVLSLYEEFQRKEGAPDYTAVQSQIIEKYLSPHALLAFQDSADPVVCLKRLKILETLEGPNSRDVKRTLIDLAGAFDEVEQWPQAKAYWDRAVLLTRRLHGEASQEYVRVLGQFADAAAWAEQEELTTQIRAKAAAIRPE